MTQPVQEPTQGRTDAAQDFRSRQLFRRPAPPPSALLFETGWTVVFGDGDTPVVTGDYQAIWKVPFQIVGDGTFNWYIYEPSAGVKSAPSVDMEIWLYRVRNFGGGTTVSSLLDSAIVIDAGDLDSGESASPPVVTQWSNLLAIPGNFDSLMVGINVAGGATGLSINVPIGIEQPPGSGYHIP